MKLQTFTIIRMIFLFHYSEQLTHKDWNYNAKQVKWITPCMELTREVRTTTEYITSTDSGKLTTGAGSTEYNVTTDYSKSTITTSIKNYEQEEMETTTNSEIIDNETISFGPESTTNFEIEEKKTTIPIVTSSESGKTASTTDEKIGTTRQSTEALYTTTGYRTVKEDIDYNTKQTTTEAITSEIDFITTELEELTTSKPSTQEYSIYKTTYTSTAELEDIPTSTRSENKDDKVDFSTNHPTSTNKYTTVTESTKMSTSSHDHDFKTDILTTPVHSTTSTIQESTSGETTHTTRDPIVSTTRLERTTEILIPSTSSLEFTQKNGIETIETSTESGKFRTITSRTTTDIETSMPIEKNEATKVSISTVKETYTPVYHKGEPSEETQAMDGQEESISTVLTISSSENTQEESISTVLTISEELNTEKISTVFPSTVSTTIDDSTTRDTSMHTTTPQLETTTHLTPVKLTTTEKQKTGRVSSQDEFHTTESKTTTVEGGITEQTTTMTHITSTSDKTVQKIFETTTKRTHEASSTAEDTTTKVEPAPECPTNMIAGRLFCYGKTPRNETFMDQMYGCSYYFGKGAKLVPEYALYDSYDRQLILNMTAENLTTRIMIDPEGNQMLRNEKKVVIRDLTKFPWTDFFGETAKEYVDVQEITDNVINMCRVPKYNAPSVCSTGTLFTTSGLSEIVFMPSGNNTLYKTGDTLAVRCKKTSTYVPVWYLFCAGSWWSPSPDNIECKIKRGTPYEPTPVGFYQPYVEHCGICWDTGTEKCVLNEGNGTYRCICKEGYEGFHCEGVKQFCGNDTQAAQFCNHHGICYNNVTRAVCECYYGWGGEHCEFDRLVFDWNAYGYLSFTQITSTIQAIALYLYFMLLLTDTGMPKIEDRFTMIRTARVGIELGYIICFAFFRKPQIMEIKEAHCTVFFSLTHSLAMMVLLFYASECLTYMGVKVCWHRNVWSNWDDRDLNTHRARNVWMYCGIPFYLSLLTAFGIGISFLMERHLSEDWTCLGRLEHIHSKPASSVLLAGGFFMTLSALITWAADLFEREADDKKIQREAWFKNFAPMNIDFTNMVTRQRYALRWLPKLFFLQYLLGVATVTYPEYRWMDVSWATISVLYSIMFIYQAILVDFRAWNRMCNWMMLNLPKKLSPQFNSVTFMNRDETLAWLKPDKFWNEVREEVRMEEECAEKELNEIKNKRERMMSRFSDLPNNLLPHVPMKFDDRNLTFEQKVNAKADQKLKYKPFGISTVNEYIPIYLQEVIQLNIIKNYLGDRLKRKGTWNALDTAVHYGLVEYDFWKENYVKNDIGKCTVRALKQLTDLVAEIVYVVPTKDWNRYRRENPRNVQMDEELRRRNPGVYHYLKARNFVKPWISVGKSNDEKADEIYRRMLEQVSYRQTQGPPYTVVYGNMMQRFANLFRAPPQLYINRFPYIRTLRAWHLRLKYQEEHDEDTNENWEKIFDNDEWFERLTDYQQKAIRSEFKVHTAAKKGENINPRKLSHLELYDSYWEWRRPTFIGPRQKHCFMIPDLGHPLCSHRKRWCEEADEFEWTNYVETQQAPFERARNDGQSYDDHEEVHRRENHHIPNPGDHGVGVPEWALPHVRKKTAGPNRFY